MSSINEKVTAPRMSAATDNRQSLSASIETSISEREPKINEKSDLDDWLQIASLIAHHIKPDYTQAANISLAVLYLNILLG